MIDRIIEDLDVLAEELSREAMEDLIEILPKIDPNEITEDDLRNIYDKIFVLDGIRDALLRLNAAELGKRLGEAILDFLEKLDDERAKVMKAFVTLFLAEMKAGLHDRSWIDDVRSVLDELDKIKNKDALYTYIYTRSGIHLARWLESAGREDEARKVMLRVIDNILSSDEDLVYGDANVLVMLTRLNIIGMPDEYVKKSKELLEKLGFARGDKIIVPTFLAAMFYKDLKALADRLGMRIGV